VTSIGSKLIGKTRSPSVSRSGVDPSIDVCMDDCPFGAGDQQSVARNSGVRQFVKIPTV
jgi:hypothetical protein